MTFPTFGNHPNEKSDFEPAIVRWLKAVECNVVVLNGVIDLAVISNNSRKDTFLELKVCLKGKDKSPPVTKDQWALLKSISPDSPLDSRYRILIYNPNNSQYALVTGPQAALGLQEHEPGTTSYINAQCLKSFPWQEGKTTELALLSWLNR